MDLFFLLADAKDDFNQYLDEHPVILGLGAIGLGLLIGGYGAFELFTGVSRDKRGNVLEGGTGKLASFVRLAMGLFFIGFGLFKLISG